MNTLEDILKELDIENSKIADRWTTNSSQDLAEQVLSREIIEAIEIKNPVISIKQLLAGNWSWTHFRTKGLGILLGKIRFQLIVNNILLIIIIILFVLK